MVGSTPHQSRLSCYTQTCTNYYELSPIDCQRIFWRQRGIADILVIVHSGSRALLFYRGISENYWCTVLPKACVLYTANTHNNVKLHRQGFGEAFLDQVMLPDKEAIWTSFSSHQSSAWMFVSWHYYGLVLYLGYWEGEQVNVPILFERVPFPNMVLWCPQPLFLFLLCVYSPVTLFHLPLPS